MGAKLEKIGAELEKARAKRAALDVKIKNLEQKYQEEENTEIHDMVHAANLTPDQLAELLRMGRPDRGAAVSFDRRLGEGLTRQEFVTAMPAIGRSTVIGCLVGMLPALNQVVASFLAARGHDVVAVDDSFDQAAPPGPPLVTHAT